MPLLVAPPRLYLLCLDRLVPRCERASVRFDWEDPAEAGPLDRMAASVVEDLLLRAYSLAAAGARPWSWDWTVFLTPRLAAAPLPWDRHLLAGAAARCKSLRRVLVVSWEAFSVSSLAWLPPSVMTLDFDGELFFRGRRPLSPPPGPAGGEREAESAAPGPRPRSAASAASAAADRWLPQAAAELKRLQTARQRPPPLEQQLAAAAGGPPALTELHLGTAPAAAAELAQLLERFPRLRLLRHYQLASALLLAHGPAWRAGRPLPRLRLRNIDADFSHVVRCRMSPEPVLPADVLALAARLCPDASSARVRVDPSTSHEALRPLAELRRLRELSVVCVSSGERALLDFADVAELLETHGAGLRSLELKVMEELDVHELAERCPRLEHLVLSGCGNASPPACERARCARLALPRLRALFFADGDDFSWDHALPPCFWPAALGGARRAGERSRLEGLFLESPRLEAAALLSAVGPGAGSEPPLPELRCLSVCRWPELDGGSLAALLGAEPGTGPRRLRALRSVCASRCRQLGPAEQRALRAAIADCRPARTVALAFD